MKKMMLFAVVMGLTVARADYAYLNFLVDQSASLNPLAFEYARVGVKGTTAYLNIQGTSSSWVLSETPWTTSSYYMDLASYASSDYAFFVELFDADFASVGTSASFGYDELKPFIATEMGQGGVTDAWTVSEFSAIPEPTAGLLMLLGLGALALRRKRRIVCAMALMFGLGVWADANDTLITFATVGPDKYADGSTVRDGECYALVWVRNGTAFAGFAADGTLVDETNGALLLTAPIAKDGRCPPTGFEINAKLAAKYADGTFAVYLLDTRLASGAVGGVAANGRAVAVNGYGKVEFSAAGDGAAEVVTQSAIPADAPQPEIKAIKVVGGNVYLTVAGTVPYLQYRPVKVGLGSGGDSPVEASPVQGVADEDIIIVAPATGTSGFYKVGRH